MKTSIRWPRAVAALLCLTVTLLSSHAAANIPAAPTATLIVGETLIRHVQLTHPSNSVQTDGATPAEAAEIFEIRGLEPGRRYEARVSFPGSPPFAYTLTASTSLDTFLPRGGAADDATATQRQLFDTERITFEAGSIQAEPLVTPEASTSEEPNAVTFKPPVARMYLRVAISTMGRGRIVTPESASARLRRHESLDAAYTVVVEPLHFGVIAATMVPSLLIAVGAGLFALVVAAPAMARHMHAVAEAVAELKEQ